MPGAKSDKDVWLLWDLMARGKPFPTAARAANMSLPTARKYRRCGTMPSEMKQPRDWRTRDNPFGDVWPEIEAMLREEPRLKANTIFAELREKHPGRFQDGQLRTLQRHIRQWRASDGPDRETFFPQIHYPGDLGASDFTNMNSLNITISGQSFPHLLYHFVLTYSNWETASICFSESFESLAEGFQRAVWLAGGVPRRHRTDCLSAAVKNNSPQRDFTAKVYGLMRHYGVRSARTNPSSPNENGDCESLHGHLKTAIDQALLLRGSRDFVSREDYQSFLDDVFGKKNAGRRRRFQEECKALGSLPAKSLPCFDTVEVAVRSSSTIRVKNNTYSVPSRLIGEEVTVRVFAERLEIWYAQRCTDRMPRLYGKGKHRINYRHVIDSLVRKPGAFENYRWRDDLFPSVRFRMAYDELCVHRPVRASREYLAILYLAARESESAVEGAIERLLEEGRAIDEASVKDIVEKGGSRENLVRDPKIPEPDFEQYNMLFETNMTFDAHMDEDICFLEVDLAPCQDSLERIGTTGAQAPDIVAMEGLFNIDMEDRENGEIEKYPVERGTDGDASRASSADSPDGVRTDGPSSREPVAQLRAVSRGPDPPGVRGATDQPYSKTAEAVEDSIGKNPGDVRDGATAPEGESPGEDASWRRFPRPR